MIILLAGIFLASFTINIHAQSWLDGINTNLWNGIEDLKPFTTNREAQLQLGFGKNTVTHEKIYAGALTVPLDDNFGAGLVAYRIGSEWAVGAVTLSYGVTNTMPIFGRVRSFMEDGWAKNYSKNEYANFFSAGQSKDFALTKPGGGWWLFKDPHVGLGYTIANTSDRPGVDIIGGIHIRSKFGKK